MYLIAVVRWGAPLQQELPFLARLTGIAVPDLRIHIGGQLPLFFVGGLEAPKALEMTTALAERGHRSIASDMALITPASEMFSPRTFELRDRSFVGHSFNTALEVPYDDIVGLIRATARFEEDSAKDEKQRKLSLGRMAMTGGLVMRKTVSKRRRATESVSEPVLYLYRRSGQGHMYLREGSLQYKGLGTACGPTRNQNFNTLCTLLEERARGAFVDSRFVSQRPPKLPLSALDGSVRASELDLAAHMMVGAALQGLLDP